MRYVCALSNVTLAAAVSDAAAACGWRTAGSKERDAESHEEHQEDQEQEEAEAGDLVSRLDELDGAVDLAIVDLSHHHALRAVRSLRFRNPKIRLFVVAPMAFPASSLTAINVGAIAAFSAGSATEEIVARIVAMSTGRVARYLDPALHDRLLPGRARSVYSLLDEAERALLLRLVPASQRRVQDDDAPPASRTLRRRSSATARTLPGEAPRLRRAG